MVPDRAENEKLAVFGLFSMTLFISIKRGCFGHVWGCEITSFLERKRKNTLVRLERLKRLRV